MISTSVSDPPDRVFVSGDTTAAQVGKAQAEAKRLGGTVHHMVLCTPTADCAVPPDVPLLDYRDDLMHHHLVSSRRRVCHCVEKYRTRQC